MLTFFQTPSSQIFEGRLKTMENIPQPSIEELLEEGDVEKLRKALDSLSPFEIAELLASEPEEDIPRIFGVLPPEPALNTFEFLSPRIQRILLQTLPSMQAAHLLNSLSPDDRTAFLQELPRATIDELVKLLSNEERILTLTLLGYPEGSVGRLMTPDYIAVKLDWTIEEVLDHIREYGHDSETISVIYVVDDNEKLIDDIKIRDFLFVPKTYKVEDIADREFIALNVDDTDETAINIFRQYNRVALPVIDDEGKLLGIVTIDDILRLSNQEDTEDIQQIGGTEPLNESYMHTPFLELMRKRASWLVILFVGEMFTATAMGFFENEIAKAVVLALFLPLIISSGGNAGSQASTLVIRALALGEIHLRDWWKIISREVFSGLFLGTVLGIVGFARVTIWSSFSHIYGEHWLLIAITIFLALIGVVFWGSLVGAMLPLILRLFRLDPAVASAPFVATIVDVTGIVIYFLIALLTLKGTLL
jgi:magnesium transporter